MHAVEVAETGGPEALNYVDRPEPSPAAGEVVIRTEAIGINYVDTYFRSGQYPVRVPFVVGNEAAGTVSGVGADVSALRVGDRVVTAAASGAYAEYCTAPAALTAQLPPDIDFDVAAAALLKGVTAQYLTKSVYPVQSGDSILLHAGAGGVGLILTQWATALGAQLITTVSTPAKAELSRRAGAVEVLGYPDPGGAGAAAFGGRIRDLTGGAGVAAVFDGVGASTFEASLASLAVRGMLVLFGAASGPVPPVDPQRLNTAGSVYLTRPALVHFTRTGREFSWRAGELFDMIRAGSIAVTVSRRYRLADAARAHRDLQDRKTIGSTVLVP